MKISNLRIKNRKIISIILAFNFILLPIMKSKGESKKFYNNIVVITDDNNKEKYQRYDEKTKEYHNLSFFDKENIKSKQYGANQHVFKRNIDDLINDPLIWEKLQDYYPEDTFESREEAIFVYKKYLGNIYSDGCGYACVCDYIFHAFENREEKFKKIFGYPMYTIDESGNVDYNFEVFMLDFFNFLNLNYRISREDILNSIAKDICEFRMQTFLDSDEYNIKPEKSINEMTDEEFIEWNKLKNERDEKFKDYYRLWENFSNYYIDYGIKADEIFGYLEDYLNSYGIKANVKFTEEVDGYNVGDIVACDNMILVKDNGESIKYSLHYVYVTEIKNDGKVMVSSWGQRFILDDSTATWKAKIVIKEVKKKK